MFGYEGFSVSHGESVVTQVWVSDAGVQVWVELVRKPGTVMGVSSTRPGRVTGRGMGQRSNRRPAQL